MIPVELKIKGLYSFKEEQVINFGTLLESHIFGIFGKVGSGKSTILEAISFVLYGKSERLATNDNRNYNMMNLQSNEMRIEFVFKAGTPKTSYKAVAFAKRAKKRFEDVKKIERDLYRQENGVWVPIETQEIASIIGLSYDNFKRAIIIPQGKFQEFLGLTSKHRSEMLKEIFHLHKFDLYGKASSLNTKNNTQISHLNGQLKHYEMVTPTFLKEQKAALKLLNKSHEDADKQLKISTTKLKESEKVKLLFENLEKAQKEHDDYVQKYDARVQKMELEAQNVAYCNQHFKAILEQAESQKNDLSKLQAEVEKANLTLKSVDNQLVKELALLKELEEKHQKKEFYQSVVLGIEKGVERFNYLLSKEKTDAKRKDFEKKITNFEKKIASLEQSQKQVKLQKEKLEKELPDWVELTKIRDWYEVDKDKVVAIKDLGAELNREQKELDALEAKKLKDVEPILDVLPKLKNLSAKDSVKVLNEMIVSLNKEIKKVMESERKLMTQSALVEHATHLEDGEACPVCGALEHPNLLNGEDVEEKLDKAQVHLVELQDLKEKTQAVLVRISALSSLEQNHQNRIGLTQDKIDVLHKSLAAHQKTKFWDDNSINSLATIVAKVQAAEAITQQIDVLSQKEKTIAKNLQEEEALLKAVVPKMDAIEKERDQLQSKIELLKEQIMQVSPKVFQEIQEKSAKEMEDLGRRYKNAIQKNEENFKASDKKVDDLKSKKTTLLATLDVKNKDLSKEQKVLDKINLKLNNALTKSNFNVLGDIVALLAKNIDPRSQLEKVEKYKKEVFSKKEKVDELLAQTKKLKFDADEYAQIQATITTQEKALKDLVGNLAKTQSSIEDLTKRIAEKKVLEKDLKALELRSENIKKLLQLFKAQGFVDYISSVYLQNIVKAANYRFQNLTKHELSLELKEDNSLRVRDQLNGGKTRNIKTLSGGQTFQAALCLALALADNIHELTKSEKNFFFLDEGFGSQDNESISDVFKTLKALRKENRTVGIISHVDILQEEIDVHLTVQLDSEKGSVIHQSW